jgi:16S rRNA (guanine527-N7)-methyltransferase
MSAVPLQFDSALAELSVSVSEERQARILAHWDLIAKWNQVYNLTAIREADKALTHHVLDSLAVLPYLGGVRVVDIGSGAGFPGVPLALARPDWDVTLVESNHKKATFLRQVLAELEISNATVVGERVESFRPATAYDVVISRAFSDLPEFIKLSGHLVACGGVLAAMKGLYPDEELALLPGGWKVEKVASLRVPGLAAARHLVLVKAA